MSKRRTCRPLGGGPVLASLFLLFTAGLLAVPAHGQLEGLVPPDQINIDFEGCNIGRIDPAYDLEGNNFICEEDDYTDGNLGKGWAELDLVPHRVFLEPKSSAPATQTYNIVFGGDNVHRLTDPVIHEGYDLIDIRAVSGGCTVVPDTSFGDAGQDPSIATGDLGRGGADQQVYQVLEVTQTDTQDCRIDVVLRLAVGASQYTGSSLQSFILFGTGDQTIPLPVKDVVPQGFDKNMTATQGQSYTWNITKSASPTTVNFGDTCVASNRDAKDVSVTVSWTRSDPSPSGNVEITSNITATNTANRIIVVNIEDVIKNSSDAVLTALVGDNPKTDFAEAIIDPGDDYTWTHVIEAPASEILEDGIVKDVAVASYTDYVFGCQICADQTAEAMTTVQLTGEGQYETATVTDVEEMTDTGGGHFTFSIEDPTGNYGGYMLGTETTGPVTWTSLEQSGGGSITFLKKVYVDEPTIASGQLSDEADLLGIYDVAAATADVAVLADATVELTVRKSIGLVLDSDDSPVTFDFNIVGPGAYDQDRSITFNPTEGGPGNYKSFTLTGLVPGAYTVTEDATGTGFVPDGGTQQTSTITLPTCSDTLTFDNNIPAEALARAQVQKITLPAGLEDGWTFSLYNPSMEKIDEVTTDGSGFDPFAVALTAEGTYTVMEGGTTQTGSWRLTNVTPTADDLTCTFTVDYPDDEGQTFSCTFSNTKDGNIIIAKETIPDGDTDTLFRFTDDIEDPYAFDLKDDGVESFMDVVPGQYDVTEADPRPDYDLTDITCEDDFGGDGGLNVVDSEDDATPDNDTLAGRTATINVDPGETVKCTFTNTKRGMARVIKTVAGGLPDSSLTFIFQIRRGASEGVAGTVIRTDSTPVVVDSSWLYDFDGIKLVPARDYSLCEVGMSIGWHSSLSDMTGAFVPGLDNSTVCVPFELDPGETEEFVVDNRPPPGGDARTIGFWRNWSSCTNGWQYPMLDATLTAIFNAGNEWRLGTLRVGELTCMQARYILSKRNFNNVNVASHPAYALASQMLAVILNINAPDVSGIGGPLSGPSERCPALMDALSTAQGLLWDVSYNGYEIKLRGRARKDYAGAASSMLYYADQFDAYNNNEFGSYCN